MDLAVVMAVVSAAVSAVVSAAVSAADTEQAAVVVFPPAMAHPENPAVHTKILKLPHR